LRCFMRTYRRTDVTKLIGAFGDYANGPKIADENDEYFIFSILLIFLMFIKRKWQ
jgi:hypothetical protein